MDNSAYEPPQSDVGSSPQPEVPEKVSQKIKHGWIAALVSGLLTFGVTVIAITTGTMNGLFDLWTIIDVGLIFLLAFGIYKKSRVAATVMFAYFLASKIWLLTETGQLSGIVVSLIFLYFYFQAMIGTFQYHKVRKNADQQRAAAD